MAATWSKYITQRTVLRVMQSGFTLVLLLLGAACIIAVRGTRAIQVHADTVVREELTIARLLNEVQAEEMTLTAVLHRLIDRNGNPDPPTLLRELTEADQAVTRAAQSAQHSPEAAQWLELQHTAKQFTAAVRQALETGDQSDLTRRGLFAMHRDVVRLVQGLVSSSSQRAIRVDHLLAGRSKELADDSLILLGFCFLLALVCAFLTIRMTRQSVQQVEAQASELGRVSWHMLQTQEEAARRFSHELHDELGQSLAAIRANVAAVSQSDFQVRRSDCLLLVDEAIANVRELSQLLRPVILDDFGLDAALRWFTEKFSQRTNIAVRYVSTLYVRLDDQCETHLFRIAQEALTNVARHSHATVVDVRLQIENGSISLTVEDNGRGLPMDQQTVRSSLGMVGMRARAREAGGELTLNNSAQGGVRVQVEIPQTRLIYAAP
ncbi:MAG TPA: sensor histidine kinase [Bryobacteraceae bacterium]|nr:sensor histidine kinase [Bryobacteraceae bacterium]